MYTHAQTACRMPDSSRGMQLKLNCVVIYCSKCHSEIFSDKKVIAIYWGIGQNFGPVYELKFDCFDDNQVMKLVVIANNSGIKTDNNTVLSC